MSQNASTTQVYYDVITSFEGGVNSGITPILLPKNQLAFALNATVRGGNVTCRPPVQRQAFDFGGDEELESAVLRGFFQGSGVYRPDFGPSQIIAQISGRLFAFTPNSVDWVVTEISVPGDLNDPEAPQVWMWQSEKWMIIQNGLTLPIFYDGVSSRRSYGPSTLLATATALAPTSPPFIGQTVVATLTAPYTGPYDVPVIFNGAFYQPKVPGSYYAVKLKKIFQARPTSPLPTAGITILTGGNTLGPAAPFAHITYQFLTTVIENMYFPAEVKINTAVNVGDTIYFVGKSWTVMVIKNATTIKVQRNRTADDLPVGSTTDVESGTLAYKSGGPAPYVSLGVSQGIISSSGDEYIVGIPTAYSGAIDLPVYLVTDPGAGPWPFYLANPAGDLPPSTSLTLVNLSDTDTNPYLTPPRDGTILSVPELPAGRMGAYGMGRNWISQIDGISYVASDIVGGAAGTQASNFRDSVLKMTENDFLSGGGYFRLPGSGNIINSMTFMATLDASQGQGALQIGTDVGMFSNNTPVDRDDWANLTNPILTESLIGSGPLAQNSTVLANSDILFRSIEGLGSLVIARRNFGEWGNTPISREMDPIFRADNTNLLIFSSAVVFDNRFLITASPTANGSGTYHRAAVALNFDTISSMRTKLPPVYDGMWTGLNILQFMVGNFSGTGRSFAFGYDLLNANIELYELLTTIGRNYFDNGDTRIVWVIETPVMFKSDVKPMSELCRLLNGEIYVQEVVGVVHVKVEYRPDFYPCWVPWKELDICADTTIPDGKPGYRTRVSFGEPAGDACDEANGNRQLRVGHFFQFRFTFTGKAKFMGFRAQVTTQPEPNFAPPVCLPICEAEIPMPT